MRVAEALGMTGLDAENTAGANEQGAGDGNPVGHVAEEDPSEQSGKNHHGVVEGRNLRRAGLAVGQDDEVLREGIKASHAQQEQPFVRGG